MVGATEFVLQIAEDGYDSEDEGGFRSEKLAEQTLLGAWGMGGDVAAARGTWKGNRVSWVMMRDAEAATD